MYSIEVSNVAKSFGETKAVRDVSFTVNSGEIFGLLGPNGAGKTTIIRMILNIFKPDKGTISILGGAMTEEKKERIGYMPEERGLYLDLSLERCLLYLATLKGVPPNKAQADLAEYFDRFDLTQHKSKKVKVLSKGMQQKAQIINTVLHKPELVIIDEPFTSLDPLNVQLVKTLIRELRNNGTTIIMSTHQMHQVEALCDRILLIDDGEDVLYGDLKKIQRDFSGHAVWIRTTETLPEIPGVEQITTLNGNSKLSLADTTTPQEILSTLISNGIPLEKFEIAIPSLDEIFIQVVEGREKA